MSLTTAMEIARANMNVIQTRTSVVSRNVANASTEFASRKTLKTVTGVNGYSVQAASINRATNDALFRNLLAANSDVSRQQAIVDSLYQLETSIGDTEQDSSPAALIGKLSSAVRQYSAAPSDLVRAQAVISAGNDVVVALNNSSNIVQNLRLDTDKQIADSITNVNRLLSEYDVINKHIIDGTRFDHDVTDYLDQRDKIISDLSKEMGIRTVSREYNEIAIFTDSGVTLYDAYAREVTFEQTPFFSAATTGKAVMVDGVPVTSGSTTLALHSGTIKGLADMRDDIAPTYQTQLDEMARGLIELFSETDATGDKIPGLFTNGTPSLPTGYEIGLAERVAVNATFASNATFLRDGSEGQYNPLNAPSYGERLLELLDNFGAPQIFDPSAQIGTNITIFTFASASTSWLQSKRASESNSLNYNATLHDRAYSSLSKETGVNLDYEMTILLDLERSYQATTRLVDTIDKMYQYLLNTAT